MRMCSHGTAQFSYANALAGLREAFFGPSEFVEHEGELQTERDRLGVNAMASPDHRRLFIFARLFRDHLPQRR